MNNKEKIEKAESLIKEATELLNEVKATKEVDENILGEYKNMFGYLDNNLYYVTEQGRISRMMYNNSLYNERAKLENIDYFNNFFDKKYAEKSLEFTSFNNKLLAFKWCYDRKYEPDWDNDREDKWSIYYDHSCRSYKYSSSFILQEKVVYFSTKEIAQKCCDWLNSELVNKEENEDE